jgi:hypothetical protein
MMTATPDTRKPNPSTCAIRSPVAVEDLTPAGEDRMDRQRPLRGVPGPEGTGQQHAGHHCAQLQRHAQSVEGTTEDAVPAPSTAELVHFGQSRHGGPPPLPGALLASLTKKDFRRDRDAIVIGRRIHR